MLPNFLRRAAAARACLSVLRACRSLCTALVVAAFVTASIPAVVTAAPASPRARMDNLVSGVVKDSAGVPLSNVQVVVSGANRSALTDDRGRFTVRGLPPGTQVVEPQVLVPILV